MPLLRGNLHTHTTFSDGRRHLDEAVARYRELGYDFLAITDHDDRIQDDYWHRIPAGDGRFLILPGVELDCRPLGQHVGKVMGDRETLYVLNHPARYALTVEQTVRRIRWLGSQGVPIHAVEVTDTGVYRAEYDVEAIALPKVATDDAHGDEDFGRAWIEVDAARTPDAILRAIKAGDFRLGFAAEPRQAGGRGWDLLGLSG
jgi:predicted metal-dependent phosphoesterase TrpH